METIKINVAEYYNNPNIYKFIPEVIFDALEKAFLDAKEFAEVPKIEFEEMVKNIDHAKKER